MDLGDKLNRLIQECGVFESEEVASDNDAADIVDYYTSSGDEWTSDDSRQTKTITGLAGVHLTAATRSFQVPQRAQSPKYISANSNTEQSSSTGMLLNLNVPSFSGISQKCMKMNEKTGLFETDSESSSEICGDMEVTLNPETGLFEIIETEIEPLSEVKTDKKRLSRQEQWERTKKIKSNLKNHALKDLPDCRCNCKNKLRKKGCETVLTKFINLKNHTDQNTYLLGCLQEINPNRFRPRRNQNEKALMKEGNSEVVLKVKDYKKLYDVRIKTNLPGISKCRKVTFRKIGKPAFSMSMKGLDMKPLSLYKVGYSRRINEVPENCYKVNGASLTLKAVKLQDIKRLLESVPESERYFYDDLFNDTRHPITVESDSADEVE